MEHPSVARSLERPSCRGLRRPGATSIHENHSRGPGMTVVRRTYRESPECRRRRTAGKSGRRSQDVYRSYAAYDDSLALSPHWQVSRAGLIGGFRAVWDVRSRSTCGCEIAVSCSFTGSLYRRWSRRRVRRGWSESALRYMKYQQDGVRRRTESSNLENDALSALDMGSIEPWKRAVNVIRRAIQRR